MPRRRLPLLAVALLQFMSGRAHAIGVEQYHDTKPGTVAEHVDETPASARRVTVTLDTVFGWGNGSVAQLVNARSSPKAITVIADRGRYVESFLPSVRVRIARDVALGVTLPFTFLSFTTDDGRRLGAASLGNLTMSGAWSPDATPWTLSLALGAPTAQGAPPGESDTAPLDASQQNGINRFYAQDAATRSRGMESTAPWAYERWSVAPKVSASWTLPSMPLTVGGALQMENLFAAESGASDPWAIRATPSACATWRFSTAVEASLRTWVGIPIRNSIEAGATWAAEPSVRIASERVSAQLGVIFPIAKPADDPRYFGLRVMIGVLF